MSLSIKSTETNSMDTDSPVKAVNLSQEAYHLLIIFPSEVNKII